MIFRHLDLFRIEACPRPFTTEIASAEFVSLATTHHTSLRAARCIKCCSATLQGRATQQHEAKASNYIFLLCASVVRPFKVVPPSARGQSLALHCLCRLCGYRSVTLQGRALLHEAKASNYIFLLCASVVRPFKVVPPSARG